MERVPVIDPAPSIELRFDRTVQLYALLAAHEAQHKPYLLLTDAARQRMTSNEVPRQLVAQPIARGPDHLHVLRLESGLLPQLAKHRLLRRLASLNAALRKLPS